MSTPSRFVEIGGNLVELNKVMAVNRREDGKGWYVTFKSRRIRPIDIGDEEAERLKGILLRGGAYALDGKMFGDIGGRR